MPIATFYSLGLVIWFLVFFHGYLCGKENLTSKRWLEASRFFFWFFWPITGIWWLLCKWWTKLVIPSFIGCDP